MYLPFCAAVMVIIKGNKVLSHIMPHKNGIPYILHSCCLLCAVLIWGPDSITEPERMRKNLTWKGNHLVSNKKRPFKYDKNHHRKSR